MCEYRLALRVGNLNGSFSDGGIHVDDRLYPSTSP
jgi:hypothetical protein